MSNPAGSLDGAPEQLTLGCFLGEVAARYAEREAVVFEGRRLAYADLQGESLRLARGLVGAGVGKGSHVALLMTNRPEWITAAFAVGMLGGVIVPISSFATPAEREEILRHSDAALLLTQSGVLARDYLGELCARHPGIEKATPGRIHCAELPQLRAAFVLDGPGRGGIQDWDALLALGREVPEALIAACAEQVDPSDDAFIIYTSGSTGMPKGVVHRHRAAVTQFWRFAEQFRFGDDERVYSAQPFFWTAGIAMTIGGTLAVGGTLLLEQVFEPGRALDLMEGERATHVFAWAHQSQALADHPSAPARDLSRLRRLAPDSPLGRLLGAREDTWSPSAAFGMTETFTLASSLPADAPAALRNTTHGRPLPGMEIRIVDPSTGRVLPPGEAGEIQVRGVTLMRGYHKVDPGQVFSADGFFATGDGGHFDADGYLHWSGRLDDLIKTGGANVSPREIEGWLARCPQLQAGLAVGVPHPTLGQIVVVCAVPAAGLQLDEEEVRAFLAERLASYKLPRRTFFFEASELETTDNAKIRSEPLRQAALARLADEGAEIAGHRYG